MKEKIEKLSKGIFEYELQDILLSDTLIRIKVEAGKVFCGSFLIKNRTGSKMKGILYSSCEHMKIKTSHFVGELNKIVYEFDAVYLQPDKEIKGEISIISDCGEVLLPFQVKIVVPYCESSLGKIRDLFQLTNLAKANWEEAKSVFVSDAFAHALFYKEKAFLTAYEQLRVGSSADQALEEFLISNHKKTRVRFHTETTQVLFVAEDTEQMERVIITKDTWGYGMLQVRTEGDFFTVSTHQIRADQFVSNCFELQVEIVPTHVKEGIYTGRILLENIYQSMSIEVICVCAGRKEEERKRKRERKSLEAQLVETYLSFRTSQIHAPAYIAESERMIERLLFLLKQEQESTVTASEAAVIYEKQELYELYRIYLSIIGGKERYTKELLQQLQKRKESYGSGNPFLMAVCLYLEAMAGRSVELAEQNAREIRNLWSVGKTDARITWLLLYMDRRYDMDKGLRLQLLKENFDAGNQSPIFYYEAAVIWNADSMLLRELSGFEIQAVRYALKNNLLNKEACTQFTYLASKEKVCKQVLLFCLMEIYEKYHLKEAIHAIATVLVRMDKREPKYQKWYQMAIRAQSAVQGIYEYYLYSADQTDRKPLDQPLLLYFIYNNELPADVQAYLYANIVYNKENNASIYRAYLKRIEQFVVSEIKKGNIDKNRAYIYMDFLRNSQLDEETAEIMAELLFCCQLECTNPNVKEVLIIHKEEKKTDRVPLVDGKAIISLYTENAEILLVDEDGGCYLSTIDYTVQHLLPLEEFVEQCYALCGNNRKLLLYMMVRMQLYRKSGADMVELCRQLCLLPDIDQSFRQNCVLRLVNYYYDNFEGERLDFYLRQLDLKEIEESERVRMIELFIIRDHYEQAMESIKQFGYETVGIKRLAKLCRKMVSETKDKGEPFLLQMCYWIFKNNRYEETIFEYLVRFYYGTTAEMFALWKEAKERDFDTEELEERVLGQMLFAESYLADSLSVFMSYYRSGCNKKLIRAVISYFAYKYLVHDYVTMPELFEIIRKEVTYEENRIAMLALLKYYADQKYLSDVERNFIDYYIQVCTGKGQLLPFFQEFAGKVPLPHGMADKYYVEYHANPNKKVWIYYLYDGNEESGFQCEEMQNICYGIFVKEFTLFYNEMLQYYIVEEDHGERVITESCAKHMREPAVTEESSKYGQLNLILLAKDMQDEKTVQELMEQYAYTDYMEQHVFSMIKNEK